MCGMNGLDWSIIVNRLFFDSRSSKPPHFQSLEFVKCWPF